MNLNPHTHPYTLPSCHCSTCLFILLYFSLPASDVKALKVGMTLHEKGRSLMAEAMSLGRQLKQLDATATAAASSGSSGTADTATAPAAVPASPPPAQSAGAGGGAGGGAGAAATAAAAGASASASLGLRSTLQLEQRQQYLAALELYLLADESFCKVPPHLLRSVDNYAHVCLDIVWT